MALTGMCAHETMPVPSSTTTKEEQKASAEKRPLADLWLSIMTSCGEDEGKLAHLFFNEEWNEKGMPCDAFDDDDSDLFY